MLSGSKGRCSVLCFVVGLLVVLVEVVLRYSLWKAWGKNLQWGRDFLIYVFLGVSVCVWNKPAVGA